MTNIIELRIKNNKDIYREVTNILHQYKEKPAGAILFIVEGTKSDPIIGLRYPGKKVKKRLLKKPRTDSALWANLYDFEVVPFENGKELNTQKFTFEELMKDFVKNKKDSEDFWSLIEELYEKNTISRKPLALPGIDPTLYLLVLKWIWIQEDFNYRFSWEEVDSPIKYRLENRTGTATSKGAGRAKFFAALILLKHHSFDFEKVKKIIPLY